MPAATTLLQIDASNRADHFYLTEEHECYFLHEYTSRRRYDFSETNGLVSNLKKEMRLQGTPQFRHKARAIETCGQQWRDVFGRNEEVLKRSTVVPMPPSKVPGHPEYDDRMVQVARLAAFGRGIDLRQLVKQRESTEAAHTLQERPKVAELQANYYLDEIPPEPGRVVVLMDDVLTNGTHFVAARNVILQRYPDRHVVGFFIARRIFPEVAGDL